MKDLLHHHPSDDVRNACLRLLDALTHWERTTGRENVVIVKDTTGYEYRSMSGHPVPHDVTDSQLLESFESLKVSQPPMV